MGCLSDSTYGSEEFLHVDDFSGPVKHRSRTDSHFIVIKIVFILGLFGLVGYCMVYGDLIRLISGYDNCGNVCGEKNPQSTQPGFCIGADFTDKKFLKYDEGIETIFSKMAKRECVETCSAYQGYVQVLNKCFRVNKDFIGGSDEPMRNDFSFSVRDQYEDNTPAEPTNDVGYFFEEVVEDMRHFWPYLVYICLIAFALSFFFLLMAYYAAAVIVWVSLGLMVLLTTGSATSLWVMYSMEDSSKDSGLLVVAIVMTILAAIVLLIILVMRKSIQFVILLFKEAARALAAMPLMFVQPVWTFLALAFIGFFWFYFAMIIQSAGKLTQISDVTYFYYKKDTAMKVARWYNIFATFWMSQFVISCQHMVLAGAVSTWYFTRDKSNLGTPIFTGFKNLVRYHLGSVILGSLVMAIIAMIKFLMKLIERGFKRSNSAILRLAACCIRCIMHYVERIFNMISRNAYVEIAIYGQGFCPSAIRGLKVLLSNIFNAAAISSVGGFVLFIIKLLIMLITTLISAFMIWNKDNIHHPSVPVLIAAVFTFFIAHTFISVFEMIIDTLFICFCEDCEMNDGITKPYFMNRGLMEFVENSKRYLKLKETNEVEPSAPPMQ